MKYKTDPLKKDTNEDGFRDAQHVKQRQESLDAVSQAWRQ
jgi:hypothetical protein